MNTRILRSVCGTIFCAAGTLAVSSSQAAVLGNWAFEVNTPPDTTEAFTNPAGVAYQPDSGVAPNSSFGAPHVIGVHASATTAWTTPAGNGSANSFSANTWAAGDHWLFHLASTGYQDITVDWDQTRSGTGPDDFKLEYSDNGSTFTQAGANVVVLLNGAPNTAWSAGGSVQAAFHFSRDLSAATELNNKTDIYVRLTALEAGSGTGGTGRIDNFVINANPIPEPCALGLLGVAPLFIRRRRA
jgi:hypothetical protein